MIPDNTDLLESWNSFKKYSVEQSTDFFFLHRIATGLLVMLIKVHYAMYLTLARLSLCQICLYSCFQLEMVKTCGCAHYDQPVPEGATYCNYEEYPSWSKFYLNFLLLFQYMFLLWVLPSSCMFYQMLAFAVFWPVKYPLKYPLKSSVETDNQ